MKVVCCQLDIAWENQAANYAKVRALLNTTKPSPGSLVVLPEMFSTGFSMNVAAIHERQPSETESFLSSAAKEFGVFMLGGVVTLGVTGRGRNEAVVFAPDGSYIARYCKLHPFSFGGEAKHYEGGESVTAFDCQGFTVTPFICYDLRFPEAFRASLQRGAQIFTIIANWPSGRVQHWITLLRARAIENQAYVVGVNRCGADPKLSYPGRSLVVDPRGTIVADAGAREGTLVAEVEPAVVTSWRNEFPALQDIRPDLVMAFKI